MTQYGIGVARNRFELFDMEEEDPLEVLKRQEKEREAKRKSKAAEKENKEAATNKQKQAPQQQQKQAPQQQQSQREHFPQRDQYHQPQQREQQRDRDYQREPRRRDGPVKDGFDSRGKRMFDRQSGSDKTGVKPVDKREGSGAHNWGNPKDDVEALTEEPEVEQPAEISSPEETPAKEEEVPVKELTLDEWMAMKAPREKPVFNVREAGQGEDLTRWKKMYALNKKKNDTAEEDEYEIIDCPQRVGRLKRLDIDVKFKDSGRRGGGRGGGRGGFNPRRGQNQQPPSQVHEDNNNVRDDKQQKSAPRVDNEQDFPSLG